MGTLCTDANGNQTYFPDGESVPPQGPDVTCDSINESDAVSTPPSGPVSPEAAQAQADLHGDAYNHTGPDCYDWHRQAYCSDGGRSDRGTFDCENGGPNARYTPVPTSDWSYRDVRVCGQNGSIADMDAAADARDAEMRAALQPGYCRDGRGAYSPSDHGACPPGSTPEQSLPPYDGPVASQSSQAEFDAERKAMEAQSHFLEDLDYLTSNPIAGGTYGLAISAGRSKEEAMAAARLAQNAFNMAGAQAKAAALEDQTTNSVDKAQAPRPDAVQQPY